MELLGLQSGKSTLSQGWLCSLGCRGYVDCVTEQLVRKRKKMNYAEQVDEIKNTRSNFMK